MSGVNELIRTEADGTISFGNYELAAKSKKSDFEFGGDLYKVKTFSEITKLEKNGMLVYESVPGTAVTHFRGEDESVSFFVEGAKDAQVILEMEDDTVYTVYIDGADSGKVKTGLGGKLAISIELEQAERVEVKVVKG